MNEAPRKWVGGWERKMRRAAMARADADVAGANAARLVVFGGRSNSGRLASGLHVLDLLTGKWSAPHVAGAPPDARWGHSMNAFRQWVVLFGGHRKRKCLNDTCFLDTEAMIRGKPWV